MPKKNEIIDEKDKKILKALEENARQTDSSIAKKLRISKQVANYRIQQMIKLGIISNFYTVVNVGNLGLTTYYLFLQLEKINKEGEEKIISKINSLDDVGWVISCIGKWNLVLNLNESSVANFEKTLNKIIKICGYHLYDYKFTILSEARHLGYKFLGPERIGTLYQGERNKSLKLDAIDEKILRALSQNARIDIVSLSTRIRLPVHILSYRIKKLVRKGVIEGFKPKLDITKLGYQWHLLLLKLDYINEKKMEEVIDFCVNNKNIYYVTSTIGEYNLMLDIHIKSVEELISIKDRLQNEFPELIKSYESTLVTEEHKIDYIPKGITTTAMLFDLDGTLVNTEKFDIKVLRKVLKSYDLNAEGNFKGYSLEDYIGRLTKDKKLQKEIKKAFISQYEIVLKNIQIEINNELLKYLKLGVSPMVALVTANNRKLTRQILDKTGLSRYFEVIITCEDVKQQKPNPDPYLKALKELNVSPENCIAFEDSEAGIKSAKSAGIKNIRKISY